MEQLKSTTWLGRVVALQDSLGIVRKMSLNIQNVNVFFPWELMEEQREFYGKLVMMETGLREQPSRESDPRWMSDPHSGLYIPLLPQRA
jgi:hypothetical protein